MSIKKHCPAKVCLEVQFSKNNVVKLKNMEDKAKRIS